MPNEIFAEIASIDSLGNEKNNQQLKHDSINSIAQITQSANHACFGHHDNELVFVVQIGRPLEINLHAYNTKTTIISTFRYAPPLNLINIRVFNIIKVEDGYLITGDWVIPGEHPRGYIMALNKDFSLRYWKWYSTPYPDIEIYGAIEEENYYLLYGFINVLPNTYGWFYKKVKKENGEEMASEVFTRNPHCYRMYKSEEDPEKYVGIATYGNLDKTELVPSWVLMDENFNVLKQTEFGIRFHKIQRLYGLIEFPYHSARDEEGNYVIATQQALPIDLDMYPFGPFTEVLCLTKIDPQGNVLWETRDSVMYYPDFDIYGVGKILGLNTGPNGEIYVYGDVDDLDSTINQYKSVGYIFKYDKHGCRIENCRVTSTSTPEASISFEVYPNPASDVLHIDLDETQVSGMAGLEVFDMQGRVVERKTIFQNILDIGHFTPGMYLVSLIDSSGRRHFQRFVKW